MEIEGNELCKVIFTGNQVLTEINPKIFELEDKVYFNMLNENYIVYLQLDKLEQYCREKKKLNHEHDKIIHLATIDVMISNLNLYVVEQQHKNC